MFMCVFMSPPIHGATKIVMNHPPVPSRKEGRTLVLVDGSRGAQVHPGTASACTLTLTLNVAPHPPPPPLHPQVEAVAGLHASDCAFWAQV